MTPRSSVFDRRTDGMQYVAGIINALLFAAVIWGAGYLMLVWAMP